MQISLILCHPHAGSLNHAIADAVREVLTANGHTVVFHDLYTEGFDPILPYEEIPANAPLDPQIEMHCREVAEADGFVFVHPDWWHMPPAMLKGWVDRVLRSGVAYAFRPDETGKVSFVTLLKAQRALVFTTSNTPAEMERELYGDPLENLWTRCILSYCGVKDVERTNYAVVVISKQEEREAWLADVRARVARAFPPAA
ncbi:MAG TPA: NAD(P)H-dependent oxidoreductase [Terracidiphilus sp.]|nr:NAD(P)H-dependent oxidoreductase [Terracidiphilus sp.]